MALVELLEAAVERQRSWGRRAVRVWLIGLSGAIVVLVVLKWLGVFSRGT